MDVYYQDKVKKHIDIILANPERITINVGSLTYTNHFGTFRLHLKNWLEDVKQRTLYTERGVKKIVKY